MSTYATVQDYQNYTRLAIGTPTSALQALLDEAEQDVDRVITRSEYLTGTVLGINVSGAVSGAFSMQLVWNGVVYTSLPILWDDTGDAVITSLQGMIDPYGNLIPSASWQRPFSRFYSQPWAYGPLPTVPVVVEAVNSLGRQRFTLPTVVNSTIAGATPAITQIVGGGLRQNPYMLPADYSWALNRAVCAQAEYRDQMGEEFFARAQWASVSGPEFRTTGKLPYIGPKVLRELSGTELIQRGARALAGTVRGRQHVFVPAGGTPIPDDWRMI